ncbi:MAG: glutamate synthase [bacterium]|nr:glutamate synthase [bacterium]
MTTRIPPLQPWPLSRLLARIAHEWARDKAVFGLAGRRFWKPEPGLDLSCTVAGRRVATPVGPAAGPHTQLAQNLVLGWLAGARTFELKTVQILDELDIPRPCIDMEHEGYNVEWSQELTLGQSLDEYVKGWLLLAVLRAWEPLRGALGEPGDHAFELSVGYDLAGLRHERMAAFIDGLADAGPRLDALRAQVGGPFAHLRDVAADPRLVRTATLSTFHGCPPDEIEGIVEHLMTRHGLDVTVKLNPTLLGRDTVADILHDRLGYREVPLDPEAFAGDLHWERALAMVDRLEAIGRREGREFGLKLTNTLVVRNHRGLMPGERMYLSGAPLHVLAITLLDRLDAALPGRLRLGAREAGIPVAFSAGVDKDNLADTVGLGLLPVTSCSDLLRPGGYGRLAQGLRALARRMKSAKAADLAAWRDHCERQAQAAGHAGSVAAAASRLATADGCARYGREAVQEPLRAVDHDLEIFDCLACSNCVTVCPNNAFLAVPTGVHPPLRSRSQYLVLAELCNECGNCTTFCPERGAPWQVKPRLYTDAAAWEARGRDGWLAGAPEGAVGDPAATVAALTAGLGWLRGDGDA